AGLRGGERRRDHELAALSARVRQRARPAGPDQRRARRHAPARSATRAARHPRAGHLSPGRGGLLSAARRDAGPDPLEVLARGTLRPYYLLHGEETWLVDRALHVLRGRFLPAGRPGTWRTLWADAGTADVGAALDDLASPSLFGGPQVLTVRRAEALD